MTDGRLYREEARVWREPDPDGRLYREEARVWRQPAPDGRLYRLEVRVWRSNDVAVPTARPRTFAYG